MGHVNDKELLQAECKPDRGSVVLWARLVEACGAVEKVVRRYNVTRVTRCIRFEASLN